MSQNYDYDAIKPAFENYIAENEKFTAKGVKAAAARARKALQAWDRLTARPPPVVD